VEEKSRKFGDTCSRPTCARPTSPRPTCARPTSPRPTCARPTLSPPARRLLDYLQLYCCGPAQAKPDRLIADVLDCPERQIIDLAGELLEAGYMVLASCQSPCGRYLLDERGDLEPGHEYVRSLRSRALWILRRYKRAKNAVAAAEARRLVETTGQRRLFA